MESTLSLLNVAYLGLQALDTVPQIHLFLVELLQLGADSSSVRLKALSSLLERGNLLLDLGQLVSLGDVLGLNGIGCVLERLQVVREVGEATPAPCIVNAELEGAILKFL